MKPNDINLIPKWERNTALILGILIFISGLYQTFFGEHTIGLLTLLSFAAIVVPGFFTRNYIKQFPIEVMILLFIMVVIQFVFGEANDFYTDIPYYDKFVHYMLPMLLGIIGFLIFYALYTAGKLQTSIPVMMFIVIFVTMGIGALWEIGEYASDTLLVPRIEGWHQFQGSGAQDPNTDTMTDLINDTLGAIFGSLVGLMVMSRNYGKKGRATALINEVSDIINGNGNSKKALS